MQRNAEGEPPSLESLPTSSSGSPLPEHAVAGNKRQREDDFESLPSLDALKDFILRGEMVDLPLSLDLQDLADFDVRDDDAHQARLRDLQAQTNDIWLHHLEKKQEEFWNDINKQSISHDGFYVSQDLPLARIKRVMKIASCFSPRMIGADAAPALAYLGEVFIRFLTRRAWNWAAANDRRTLQYKDLYDAQHTCEMCDFLIDVVGEFHKNRIITRPTKDAQRMRSDVMSWNAGVEGDGANSEDDEEEEDEGAGSAQEVAE